MTRRSSTERLTVDHRALYDPDRLCALAETRQRERTGELLELRTALVRERHARSLLDLHGEVAELLMSGAALRDVLEALVSGVEQQTGGMLGSVLLVDEARGQLRHGVGPNLPPEWWAILDGTDIATGAGSCAAAARTGDGVFVGDLSRDARWSGVRDAALGQGLLACWSVPVHDSAGAVVATLAAYDRRTRERTRSDADMMRQMATLAGLALERDRSACEVVTLATRDPLTGLPNRSRLLAQLGMRLEEAEGEGRDVTVLYCDLDRFKLTNDSLGHEVGDAVLSEVARRLTAELRGDDLIARVGGDEFVVVPYAVQDASTAERLAHRLVEALSAPFVDPWGRAHVVEASIGVAIVGEVDVHEAVRRAGSAMDAVKRSERPVGVYSTEADRERLEELRIVERLRGALDRGDLRVVYQPIVALAEGRVEGVEALLRWRDAELGDVSPGRFIPLAEEHHLIRPIGSWVLREAIAQARAWNDVTDRPLRMSVNLSVSQFGDERLPEELLGLLAEAGLDPSLLIVEITETTVLADTSATTRLLEQLRAAGVGVHLDDFGTGFSSLTHLRTLPISGLKIDRSFISDLRGDDGEPALLVGLIRLATGLGLEIVAEGIETAAQAGVLRRAGCGQGQGYLFARPDHPSGLTELLAPEAAAA